jgi:hypothetical protein
MKKLCMFCMRSHKRKPKLCDAKGRILRAYLNEGLQMWQIFYGIKNRMIDLDGEALRLIQKEKKAA